MTQANVITQEALELERMTFAIGGGKIRDGVSAGALMTQLFINKQIEAGKLPGVEKLTADGNNGDRTKAAIAAYQKKHGLKDDSDVGIETYKAMKADGFVLNDAIKEKSAYLKTDAGKPFSDAVNEAILKQELAYVLGSTDKHAFLPVGRRGFAVAAVQNELKVEIDGVWKNSDVAALEKWQANDSLHATDENDKPLKAKPDGKFGKESYDALPWDEKTNTGFDSTKFKEDMHKTNPALAAKLDLMDALESARRQHAAGHGGHGHGGNHALPKNVGQSKTAAL